MTLAEKVDGWIAEARARLAKRINERCDAALLRPSGGETYRRRLGQLMRRPRRA